ncbi:MAG: type IV pilus secretin PilQ [Gammaproteobacteria bacterium]
MNTQHAKVRSTMGPMPVDTVAAPRFARYLASLAVTLFLWSPALQAVTLDEVTYAALPGDRVRIDMMLSEPVPEPLTFTIDNPARVALDFDGVSLNLARKTQNIGVGVAQSITAVEAGGRTRLVLNLARLVPYAMQSEGNRIVLTLNVPPEDAAQRRVTDVGRSGAGRAIAPGGTDSPALSAPAGQSAVGRGLQNIDFRRGEGGEGRVTVTLSSSAVVVDTREQGNTIIIDFLDAALPPELERKLDVTDFATPVQSVSTTRRGNNVRMTIRATGAFDHLAYQSENIYSIDVKPLTRAQEEELRRERFEYTGERLSLNFQNIEVRAVLQLIADFTGLNLVASDTVGGSLTLRLKNVPWDQALDIILKTKGLAMRQTGNVILVAPTEEIAAREKLELEAQAQLEELAPLRSEFIQVNYAKADTIASLLKAEGNSLLSERGNVSVDQRTNTLLVRDTGDALESIRRLVTTLDVPIRQVMIESRIVVADDTFNRDLGVRFGISNNSNPGGKTLVTGGSLPGTLTPAAGNVGFSGEDGGAEGLLVDLPVGGPSAAFQLAFVNIPNFLLQLELQAMQAEGRGEVISNPRVVTANQKEAIIEQGTEIPFQEASSSGATSTSFKKAVLSLKVSPQITPDDRIIMDVTVNQDTVGQEFGGIPSINTREINTQVLVDNGDTVVLGGIFEQTKRDDVEKVPFFGDLPYLGYLFRSTSIRDDRSELLIFITPKILKEVLSAGG